MKRRVVLPFTIFLGKTTLLFIDENSIVSSAPKNKYGLMDLITRTTTSKYLLMFSGVEQIISSMLIILVFLIAVSSSTKTPLIHDLTGDLS